MSEYSKWFWNNCNELNSDTSFAHKLAERAWDAQQTKIDELQKRIDKALEKAYTGIRKQGGDYYLELVEDILKGESNDN